ncbi:unnamed protein product [Cunninghamella blakesleeana]
MVERLYSKNLCTKIYVSSYCQANDELLKRNLRMDSTILTNELNHCDGNMLVVTDFASFSTNPHDIRKFLRKFKLVKEVVVDEGGKINIFNRNGLITNDNIINQFNCRKASPKRS